MKVSGKRIHKLDPEKHWNREIWPIIREYRLWLDGNKCVFCGATATEENPLQIHHERYDYLNTQYEIATCITLCKKCHRKEHEIVKTKD